MENENICKRSIVEQIYDELVVNIESQDEFDAEIVEKIKELITKGEIKKSVKIAEAIRLTAAK